MSTPKYLTASDAKTLSLVQSIKDAEATDLDPFIIRAEEYIDAYVGRRPHHPDDTDNHRVFPRPQDEVDGAPVVPNAIQTATLYVLEQLYLKGAPQSAEDLETMKSESVGASGSYSYARGDMSDDEKRLIPSNARKLLDQFTPGAMSLSVDTSDAL